MVLTPKKHQLLALLTNNPGLTEEMGWIRSTTAELDAEAAKIEATARKAKEDSLAIQARKKRQEDYRNSNSNSSFPPHEDDKESQDSSTGGQKRARQYESNLFEWVCAFNSSYQWALMDKGATILHDFGKTLTLENVFRFYAHVWSMVDPQYSENVYENKANTFASRRETFLFGGLARGPVVGFTSQKLGVKGRRLGETNQRRAELVSCGRGNSTPQIKRELPHRPCRFHEKKNERLEI